MIKNKTFDQLVIHALAVQDLLVHNLIIHARHEFIQSL